MKNDQISKQTNFSIPMIPITKTTDLLKAPMIRTQIIEHGGEKVKFEVKKWISKCAMALDISMPPLKLEVLASDILDKYPTESLEDVQEALKRGRQGLYSNDKESKSYGKLNMEVVTQWMKNHLEEKVRAREIQISQEKQSESSTRLIDIIDEQRKKISQMVEDNKDDAEIAEEYQKYQKFKANLKEKTKAYQDELKRIRQRKKQIDDKTASIKSDRARHQKKLFKIQYAIIISDYSDSKLKYLLTQNLTDDHKQIIKDEIEQREKLN